MPGLKSEQAQELKSVWGSVLESMQGQGLRPVLASGLKSEPGSPPGLGS